MPSATAANPSVDPAEQSPTVKEVIPINWPLALYKPVPESPEQTDVDVFCVQMHVGVLQETTLVFFRWSCVDAEPLSSRPQPTVSTASPARTGCVDKTAADTPTIGLKSCMTAKSFIGKT